MSAAADGRRNRRQKSALPGGFHDRLVQMLNVVLPIGVGALVAFMLLSPLTERPTVSFLLDRKQDQISPLRLRVIEAMYRGHDLRGGQFTISASEAFQRRQEVPQVEISDMAVAMTTSSGAARLFADQAVYDYKARNAVIPGRVLFSDSNGYQLAAGNVSLNLDQRTLVSQGPVRGTMQAGNFTADRMFADLDKRRVVLDGHARVRMIPGQVANIGRSGNWPVIQ